MARGFKQLGRRMERLAETLEDDINDTVHDGVEQMRTETRANLKANDTNWRGLLSRSITTRRRTRADGNTKHELVVKAPWGKYVEFGTGVFFSNPDPTRDVRPFKAPGTVSPRMREKIETWVRTKPVIPQHYSSDRQLAGAIAHTIAELGTRSQPFVRPAYVLVKPKIISDVKRTIARNFKGL